MAALDALFLAVSAGLLVPASVLAVQCLAAWRWRGPDAPAPDPGPRPRVTVLVPAHDEALGIAESLATIVPQLGAGDALLVVADNCTDDTAAVARGAGARVVERRDAERRGKGYALDFGIRALEASPPDVVVIVDADCRVAAGTIDRLARLAMRSGAPIQSLDLMQAPPGAGLKTRIAEFAWVVKNQVRPLGFLRLGLPCQLMGTGMAFAWPLIARADLASRELAEDLQLGLSFASAGTAPLFCPQALVTSMFPSHPQGLADQRTRWEHGHLAVIARIGPRLLWKALRLRRPRLVAMVLDLCVPPLAALALALVAWLAATGVYALLGGSAAPWWVVALAAALLGVGVMTAWQRHGRHIVTLTELLGAPRYALAKIPMYLKLLTKRQIDWVRTRRDGDAN